MMPDRFCTVPCPFCGADIGEPCMTATRKPAGGSHVRRWQLERAPGLHLHRLITRDARQHKAVTAWLQTLEGSP